MRAFLMILLPILAFPVVLKTTFQVATPKYMVRNGKPSGVGYEVFLQLRHSLKKYGIDLVWDGKFRSMEDIQNLLSSCKIDLFIGISKTKDRMKRFDFSTYPLYSLSYTVLTRKGTKNVRKIAVIGGTKTEKILLRSLPPNKKFQIVRLQSIDHAMSLLNSKDIDAIFYNSMSLGYVYNQDPEKYSISNYFSGKYYQYVAFSKCLRSDIKKTLNSVIFETLKIGMIKAAILSYNLWGYMRPGNYLVFAVPNLPPYEFTIGKEWAGIDVEVVRKIFKNLGFEIDIEDMSLARVLESIKLGVIDGTFSIPMTDEMEKYMYFSSEPISIGIDGFLYRRDRLSEKNLYVPSNLTCGYVYGYAYEDILKGETSLHLASIPDNESGVKALLAGRIDVFATNKFVGIYYARIFGKENDVGFFPVFGKDYYYLALSKIDPYHKKIVEDFSTKFEKFKHTREYERILERYGLSYEEAWTM